MTSIPRKARPDSPATAEPIAVDLKDPALAAFLAWLIPGAGHLYQRRTGKGVLLMVCILGTFLFGLYLGQGRVVYASMRPDDRRLPYFCQIGVGLPALPALVQAQRVRQGKRPLWGGIMAPPRLDGWIDAKDTSGNLVRHPNELARWHYELHSYFELGTVYTMIAGLLNVLAIYDAWAGPMLVVPKQKKRRKRSEDDR
jgi:TM2 domain-containing membrane protein YozV